jgi:hypothetical protein
MNADATTDRTTFLRESLGLDGIASGLSRPSGTAAA